MTRELYLNGKVPLDGVVLIKTADVPRLRAKIKLRARRAKSRS